MKMKKNVIILIGIIILLAAATIVILKLDVKPISDAEATPALTTKPMIDLLQKTVDEVKSIVITYQGENYTLTKNGDAYTVAEHPDMEISDSLCSTIFTAAATVYAQDVVSDTQDDLAVYGLDAPQCTVEIIYTDGTTFRCNVGNKTPSGNAYYMIVDGDARVLTMSYATSINYLRTLNSLRPVADISIVSDEFTYMKLEKNGELVLEADVVTGDQKVGITTVEFIQPWRSGINAEKFSTLLDTIGSFTFGGIASGDFDNLANYGLDQPTIKMELRTTSKSYTLLIGAQSDVDGYVYAKLEGSDLIYYLSTESAQALDVNAYDLMDKLMLLVGVGTIQNFEFQGFGEQIQVDVAQTNEVDENGDVVLDSDNQPKQTQVFSIDGKEMPEDQSRYFYQYCVGITADTPIEEGWQPTGDAVASIIYTKISGEKTRLDFYEYDKDFYAISQNGEVHFGVRREKVQAVADAIEPYLNGTIERNIAG